MDESTIQSRLEALQKRADELEGRIEEAEEALPEDASWTEMQEKVWPLEKSLAPELGAIYREMVKTVLQSGKTDRETLNKATHFLSESTSWYRTANSNEDLAENTLILARMQEMTGHYEWAEPTLRLAIWYAKYTDKKAYYVDAYKDLLKRKHREQASSKKPEHS